jgi:hypothetical protein
MNPFYNLQLQLAERTQSRDGHAPSVAAIARGRCRFRIRSAMPALDAVVA